ncbi:glycoside hydrolase family 15 protein [Rhodococcus sp. HNM0563]|uniref:glycoside hydrolase family 15 protein n=1 Tax=unclassified Rhodococcus (in: high G+C Gram-positive bacteria) TaxID=192944 RepID=UPI00146A5FD4|nr:MULTISPECIES: glycoside hydrolase family 15 protein [unclassified Rhodococcus (in: high G+C Gram-positive bacteria)]MCK0090908.1 glycoside hydrolase family 15 protein [Rhodococcus sp. F64268]NLU61050.1 glycoside hydrolase family 15 protein [Rhodococcus sp. HNM0563]
MTSAAHTPSSLPNRTPFPPIGDYGFLSDCQTSCLVARDGSVEWLCVPRPDSPSVFGSLLDRSAGHFRIGPHDRSVPAARRYLPGGVVLETTWQTETGWIVVRDALAMGPWYDLHRRSPIQRRTPSDWEAEHILLRTVRCVNGTVELNMSCEPAFDYHRGGTQWEYTGDVYEEATAVCADAPDEHPRLRLTSNMRLGIEGREARARTRMRKGDTVFVALSWGDQTPPRTFEEAATKMLTTQDYWREWVTTGRFPDHPWRTYLERSALTLKGLTYSPTGALLAAATTSLPETPGGERNWDYRYAWVRDSTFALWGLYTLGLDREADDFFSFILEVSRGADGKDHHPLQVMYGVGGERVLEESQLDHLSGYNNARPVRIGNDAYRQRQHDVWGALLDSVYLHVKSREQIPESLWPLLSNQVEQAAAHWREPDRGMWEVRGEPQHFTSSKVMCWVALDRGAKLAEMHGQPDHAARWSAVADEIKSDILEHGVDERGVFTQRYGDPALDASNLLIPLLRFLPSDDPRVRATVLAIADELTEHGLVLRYRVEDTDDGLSGQEGTFTICSFWLVSALVEIGEVERASMLCGRLLDFASPLKLYAEEIDPATGQHLGNFPQAFTHLAQINAIVHVIRAEQRTESGEFKPAHARH